MATDNIFKQLLQVIQNKRRINKGIVRRPLENTDGFVSNLYNYELDDGVAKVRLGTRVMNAETDDLWYTLDSFRIGDMDILIGINYKREVWAWLDKWPETNFKVCNSSPFVRYQKKSSGGYFSKTRQLIFQQGNKFWLEEDNLGIIIINDYGEAYRIMKKGSVRLTTDREESSYFNHQLIGVRARIYVDIKEATNKYFDNTVYVSPDDDKKGWRIAGDVRFAWTNEMGVVSELSEPTVLDGYQNVMFSLLPDITNVDKKNKTLALNRIVNHGATARSGHAIYEGDGGLIAVGATAGNVWEPTNPYPTHTQQQAYGVVLVVREGSWTDSSTATTSSIDEGIYMSMTNSSGNYFKISNEDFYEQIIQLALSDTVRTADRKLTVGRLFQTNTGNNRITSFPRLARTSFTIGISPTSINNKVSYSLNMDYIGDSSWVKISEEVEDVYPSDRVYITDALGSGDTINITDGVLYQVDLLLSTKDSGGVSDIKEASWDNATVRGVELPLSATSSIWACWQNYGYDTWKLLGSFAFTTASFDIENLAVNLSTLYDDTNFITDSLTGSPITEAFDEISKRTDRLTVWNNDHIVSRAQRVFYKKGSTLPDYEIIYEGVAQLPGDYNDCSDLEDMRIGAIPFTAMDNTGIRKISMPLPLVRRAMRNPQHVSVSGGKLYVVEDNKLWFGSSAELMLTNEVELQSGVYGIAEFDSGVVVTTKSGMFYVAEGQYQKVYNSDGVVASFIAPCSGGCIAVEDKDVYLVTKHVTDSGSWYPALQEIGTPISEVNFVGSLKSTSIGYKIYLADDWNVWVFNLKTKAWSGVFNYGSKIQKVFRFNNKLGVSFCSDIDKRNSFDTPVDGAGARA